MPEMIVLYNSTTKATVAVPAVVAPAWCAGPEGWSLAPEKAAIPSKSAEQELAEREAAEAEAAAAAKQAAAKSATSKETK